MYYVFIYKHTHIYDADDEMGKGKNYVVGGASSYDGLVD